VARTYKNRAYFHDYSSKNALSGLTL